MEEINRYALKEYACENVKYIGSEGMLFRDNDDGRLNDRFYVRSGNRNIKLKHGETIQLPDHSSSGELVPRKLNLK